MHLFSVGIRINLQLYSVSSILRKFCVILAEYIKSSNVIAKVKLKCDQLVRQTNSYTSFLLLLFRYLGSKAVKLFKVRMHGSDAVSVPANNVDLSAKISIFLRVNCTEFRLGLLEKATSRTTPDKRLVYILPSNFAVVYICSERQLVS